jgi:hypothetical protein
VLWLTPSSLFRLSSDRNEGTQRPGRSRRGTIAQAPNHGQSGRAGRYPQAVILDFALGLVAIVAAVTSARRWSRGYAARYGRRPPNNWMFSRVDDGPLERERRILIAILVLALVVALSVLSRGYATPA